MNLPPCLQLSAGTPILACSWGPVVFVSGIGLFINASFLSLNVVLIETSIVASAHNTISGGHVLSAAAAMLHD
jgi:hypothetical protein